MTARRLGAAIAALLFAASVINYVDRQTLSVVAPALTKELHISPMQYAAILNAFLVAYTVMYVGSGFLVDRWGSRASLAIFMAWWSLANVLHATVRTGAQLGLWRLLLGIGEPGHFMASFRAISEWYPPEGRALVNGLVNAGASVGALIAAPLVAGLMVAFGWRAAFVVTGAAGFVWIAAWLAVYPNRAAAAKSEKRISKSELLRRPETWGLLAARFVSDPVWWFYLFWLPKYLADQRGFTMLQVGKFAWLPYLFADAGALIGGWISGHLVKRGWPSVRARMVSMLPFALVMPASLAIPATPGAAAAVALICAITFSHMAWRTNLATITNDIYPAEVVGTVSGIIACGGGLGAALFMWLTGQIVERVSYTAIFVIMGFLHPLAYLIVRLTIPRQPFPDNPSTSSANTVRLTAT